MQFIEPFFFIDFGVCAVSLSAAMILGHCLFKSLKKSYPKYYKAIGKPIIIAPVNFTKDSYTQLLKGGIFAYSMAFQGMPKNFPKDRELRKIALAIRICLTILIVLAAILVVAGYLLCRLAKV